MKLLAVSFVICFMMGSDAVVPLPARNICYKTQAVCTTSTFPSCKAYCNTCHGSVAGRCVEVVDNPNCNGFRCKCYGAPNNVKADYAKCARGV